MAAIDGLATVAGDELLLGLYYVRLSSAAGASWYDMNRPLFGPDPRNGPDFDAVEAEISCRTQNSRTAYELVCRWALDAEAVRADRSALNQAAGLPLPNRELREWVAADAAAAGFEAPSLNKVRKELQRWVHDQVLNEIGPILPGVGNIEGQIGQIRAIVARVAPNSREETARIVVKLGRLSELADMGVEQVQGKQ